MNVDRRGFFLTLMLPGAWALVGCSGSIPIPGRAARSKALSLHSRITGGARALSAAGLSGNGIGLGVPGGGGLGAAAGNPPMLGMFLNFGPALPDGGVSRGRPARPTRQEDPRTPTFYFDEFLRLWVRIEENLGRSRYDFFEDEAQTTQAGFAETRWPEEWSVYPQTWISMYRFDAGALAGTSGAWETTSAEDGSGSSRSQGIWSDGAAHKSESRWQANGDSTWWSRNEGPGAWWSESTATFGHNGSGEMRHGDSDGYTVIYSYNPDGSGSARFAGPTADFPVVIAWDGLGGAWITYPDGRREPIEGWWGCWWGVVAVSSPGESGADPGSAGP